MGKKKKKKKNSTSLWSISVQWRIAPKIWSETDYIFPRKNIWASLISVDSSKINSWRLLNKKQKKNNNTQSWFVSGETAVEENIDIPDREGILWPFFIPPNTGGSREWLQVQQSSKLLWSLVCPVPQWTEMLQNELWMSTFFYPSCTGHWSGFVQYYHFWKPVSSRWFGFPSVLSQMCQRSTHRSLLSCLS